MIAGCGRCVNEKKECNGDVVITEQPDYGNAEWRSSCSGLTDWYCIHKYCSFNILFWFLFLFFGFFPSAAARHQKSNTPRSDEAMHTTAKTVSHPVTQSHKNKR